jgi:CHAD domain-containing protein
VPVLPLSASKAQRGFALAQGLLDAPRRARPPCGCAALLQDLAAALLGETFDQFCTNLHGLLDADHPELVHRARVGWRRWRSALRLCLPDLSLPQPTWPGLEPCWACWASCAIWTWPAPRPCPQRKAYVDGPTRAADWERTAQAFQQAAAVQRKAVRLALQEPMTGQALLGLVQWIAAPPQAAPATPRPARRWARQRTERLHQRWKKAQRKASDPASLHRARLLAKRLRYTIEALQPLLPGATQRWHAQALQAREQVGRLRDAHGRAAGSASAGTGRGGGVPARHGCRLGADRAAGRGRGLSRWGLLPLRR